MPGPDRHSQHRDSPPGEHRSKHVHIFWGPCQKNPEDPAGCLLIMDVALVFELSSEGCPIGKNRYIPETGLLNFSLDLLQPNLGIGFRNGRRSFRTPSRRIRGFGEDRVPKLNTQVCHYSQGVPTLPGASQVDVAKNLGLDP